MDDSTLVRRAARGEPSARAHLVERHGAEVWALCRRLAAEPDDAYPSTWEKVFRVIGSFSPEGSASLGTWIRVVARRTLVDLHRRAVARGPVLPAGEGPDPEPTHPAEAIDAAARARRLWAAIDALPPEQRHVIVGHHPRSIAGGAGAGGGRGDGHDQEPAAPRPGAAARAARGGAMTDDEALSHLLDGHLDPVEAARLEARLATEPALRARRDAMRGLVGALDRLEDRAPPAFRAAAPSGWRWPLGATLAAAAALLVGLASRPGPPEVSLPPGETRVDGRSTLLAGAWAVDVDGRVAVVVEPRPDRARGIGTNEEDPMDTRTFAAGLAGVALTVTVYEGRAAVRGPEGDAVEVAAGEQRAFGGPGEAAPERPPAETEEGLQARLDQLTAELDAVRSELEAERFAGALMRGRLQVVEGDVSEWGTEVPAALRPERFEAELVPRLAALPGLELAEVDCAEYPCLVALRYTGSDAGSAWGDEALDEVGAWAEANLEQAGVVASKSVFGDDEGEHRFVTLGLLGEASDAVEQRTRVRLGELGEAQDPTAPR